VEGGVIAFAVVLSGAALVVALGALIVALGTEPIVIHESPERDKRGRYRKRTNHDYWGPSL
jgi:hypothetical protein